MSFPMTDRQSETYQFIVKFWEIKKRPPSMREIALGEIQGEQVIAPRGSRNSAHVMCQRLHEMGYLRERLGFDGRKYFEPKEKSHD